MVPPRVTAETNALRGTSKTGGAQASQRGG
jgi:hypothetical protein